jgi:hypothetical protein
MPKVKELGITVVPQGFGPVEIGRGGWCGYSNCSDCTVQPFSICGGTQQCIRVTLQQPCGRTVCTDCTQQPFSICGGTHPCAGGTVCTDCTQQPFSICGGTPPPQVRQADPRLTKAQIDQLRAQLKQQLETLEEHEKSLLPKTLEGLDAREKEIAAELEQLKGVRSQLSKKK